MQYKITVKPDYGFDRAQVNAREFLKAQATILNEPEITNEIRNSPILVVEPIAEKLPAPDEPTAPAPNVRIETRDGVDEGEASAASDVLSQRKKEKRARF